MDWTTRYLSDCGKYLIYRVKSQSFRCTELVWVVIFDDKDEIACEDTLKEAKEAAVRHQNSQ